MSHGQPQLFNVGISLHWVHRETTRCRSQQRWLTGGLAINREGAWPPICCPTNWFSRDKIGGSFYAPFSNWHDSQSEKAKQCVQFFVNIARGTTDPGYWVHNSNHPNSRSMLIVESTLLTWSALFDLFFAFEYFYKTQEVVFLVFIYPLILKFWLWQRRHLFKRSSRGWCATSLLHYSEHRQ